MHLNETEYTPEVKFPIEVNLLAKTQEIPPK